jgi:peptidoglycan hydrolase CwlO-like protein
MPESLLSIAAAALTVLGAVTTAVLTYRATRKRDVTTDALTSRRDTIADRDNLIETLQEDIKNLKSDMQDQKKETADLRSEVKEVRNYNNALITFIYKMLAILRKHNLTDEINAKDVPEDIHI